EIDGTNAHDASFSSFGLNIQAVNVVVRGLAIDRFPNVGGNGFGIGLFNSAANDWIYGNYIGLTPAGAAAGNGQGGIWIGSGAGEHLIGTDADGVNDRAERNVISANGGTGVLIQVAENTVAGNYLG